MLSTRRQLLAATLSAALIIPATTGAAKGYKDISAQEAHDRMTVDANVIVVDVRTPSEFASGHIPGAINVELSMIESGQLPAALANRNATYLLYCRSGRRSGIAARILSSTGYTDVSNFGGILNWPFEVVR